MSEADVPLEPPSEEQPAAHADENEACPPAFGSWRVLYALVLLELAALILAFTVFARHFG